MPARVPGGGTVCPLRPQEAGDARTRERKGRRTPRPHQRHTPCVNKRIPPGAVGHTPAGLALVQPTSQPVNVVLELNQAPDGEPRNADTDLTPEGTPSRPESPACSGPRSDRLSRETATGMRVTCARTRLRVVLVSCSPAAHRRRGVRTRSPRAGEVLAPAKPWASGVAGRVSSARQVRAGSGRARRSIKLSLSLAASYCTSRRSHSRAQRGLASGSPGQALES